MTRYLGLALALIAGTALAQQAPSAPGFGERAVTTVSHQNIINPSQHVDGTKSPLSAHGKWSIAKTPAEGCAPSTTCLKVFYTVAESNITCMWIVQLSNEGIADGTIVDEDENAEKYLLHVLKPEEAAALVDRSGQPVYPAIAQAAHSRGPVEISWLVGKDGKPTDLRVLSSSSLLTSAALDAARVWRFKPFVLHGKAIAWIGTLTYDFQTSGTTIKLGSPKQP